MEMQPEQNKPKKRSWVWWLFGVIIFFVIIGKCSNSGNQTPNPFPRTGNVTKAAKSEPKEEIIREPAPIELAGTGQQASNKFILESGLSVFTMAHAGSSNFIVTLMDSEGQIIELLVNEIGRLKLSNQDQPLPAQNHRHLQVLVSEFHPLLSSIRDLLFLS